MQAKFLRRVLVGVVVLYTLAILAYRGEAYGLHLLAVAVISWFMLILVGRDTTDMEEKWLWSLDIVTTNLALFLVIGELALRLYPALAGDSSLISKRISALRLIPNHEYSRWHTNSHGYPAREFTTEKRPGIERIAILGDSFAVGMVPQQLNFPHLIEELSPNTEVYNFGIIGIGPREYDQILNLETLRYKPDVVIVSFFAGNDVLETEAPHSRSWMDPQAFSMYLFFYRSSRLFQEYRRQRNLSWQTSQDGFMLSPQSYIAVESDRLRMCLNSQEKELEKNWQLTLTYLQKMHRVCTMKGIRFGMVLIPDEYQVNPVLLDQLIQSQQIPTEDIDLDLPQRRLNAFCRKNQIPCLDMKPLLEPDTYLPRDTHWNRKGNRIAAEAIAGWLAGKDFLIRANATAN